MAATPFKGVLSLTGKSGAPYTLPFSASDVANAYVTFDDTNTSFAQIGEPAMLTDIVLTAAGVDTTRLDLYVAGKASGITFNDASVKNTIPVPRIVVRPWIAPGAMIQLKQIA